MAENVKKNDAESYPITTGIIEEIKKWYWALLLILSLSATIFYAAAKITYKPVYQSYAALTPSYRDGTTADKIEEIAKELMGKAQDGRLAAALSGTDAKDADIRFVADGINLAVSVRASSPEVSYETLRSITEKGVELLDNKPDYTLVLTDDSGMPKTVTNPLDTGAAAMRGLLIGAALAIAFLIFCLVRDKKKAAEMDQGEPEPAKPAKPAKKAAKAEIKPEPAKTVEPAAKTETVKPAVKESPVPAAAQHEKAPDKEPAKTDAGIPSDLAKFASQLGVMSLEMPAVLEKALEETEAADKAEEDIYEDDLYEEEQRAEEPLPKESYAAEPVREEPFAAGPVPEESYVAEPLPAEKEAENPEVTENKDTGDSPAGSDTGDEEWDPAKTSLSKEMWEIAKEMGMLDDFRL